MDFHESWWRDGPRKNRLNFGADPDKEADPGIFKKSLSLTLQDRAFFFKKRNAWIFIYKKITGISKGL